MSGIRFLLVMFVSTLSCAVAFPYPRADDAYAPVPVYGQPPPSYVAESLPVGRVKIQVYRGPSDGKGYEVFAPWGFYVTQPQDSVVAGYGG